MTLPPAKSPPVRSTPPAVLPSEVSIEVTDDEAEVALGDLADHAAVDVAVAAPVEAPVGFPVETPLETPAEDPAGDPVEVELEVEPDAQLESDSDAESRPSVVGRNEELVSVLKTIAAMVRNGQTDEAHAEYARLFGDPSFEALRPDEQRQVLRLMVMPKVKPAVSESVLDAHRVAMTKIEELARAPGEAVDFELLGVAQVTLGNLDGAREAFASALAMERAKSPGSELVGTLMKRMSEI